MSAGLPVSANAINKDVGVHTKVCLNVRHRVVSPARIAERTVLALFAVGDVYVSRCKKKVLTLHLARGEGRERYFDCNLMQCKVLASFHQHLMAEAPRVSVAISRRHNHTFYLLPITGAIVAGCRRRG